MLNTDDPKLSRQLQWAQCRIASATLSVASVDQLFSAVHKIVSERMAANSFFIALYDEKKELLTFPCQGRSKTRPLRRSKTRPEDWFVVEGLAGDGVWSEGLRRLQGGAFRPERKTASLEAFSSGVGIRASVGRLASACCA